MDNLCAILDYNGVQLAGNLCETTPRKMKRFGIRNTYLESGDNDELIEKYGFGIQHMAEECKKLPAAL